MTETASNTHNVNRHVPDAASLAVFCRQAQWRLDDVAADIQAGRVSPREGSELADALEWLAAMVRTCSAEVTAQRFVS